MNNNIISKKMQTRTQFETEYGTYTHIDVIVTLAETDDKKIQSDIADAIYYLDRYSHNIMDNSWSDALVEDIKEYVLDRKEKEEEL